jgi:hypothetical protein
VSASLPAGLPASDWPGLNFVSSLEFLKKYIPPKKPTIKMTTITPSQTIDEVCLAGSVVLLDGSI